MKISKQFHKEWQTIHKQNENVASMRQTLTFLNWLGTLSHKTLRNAGWLLISTDLSVKKAYRASTKKHGSLLLTPWTLKCILTSQNVVCVMHQYTKDL